MPVVSKFLKSLDLAMGIVPLNRVLVTKCDYCIMTLYVLDYMKLTQCTVYCRSGNFCVTKLSYVKFL